MFDHNSLRTLVYDGMPTAMMTVMLRLMMMSRVMRDDEGDQRRHKHDEDDFGDGCDDGRHQPCHCHQ